MTEDFGILNDLVAEVRATVKTKGEVKELEKKAKAAKSSTERLELQFEAERIRAQLEWRTAAQVYVAEHWECECGADGWTPQGVFLLQEHVRLANTVKLIRPRGPEDLPADLPKRVKYQSVGCAVCQQCADGKGFSKLYLPPLPKAQQAALAHKGPYTRDWEEALILGHSKINPMPQGEPEETDDETPAE